MRPTWILLSIVLALIAAGTSGWWNPRLFPDTSGEIVQLDDQKRDILSRLQEEEKFEPDEDGPLGYTGIATPQDGVVARSAVNEVLGTILSRSNGPVPANMVSKLIHRGMKRVRILETEDRDRTSAYMIEIWYILGFKSATGLFAYGSGFSKPDGYGEPLPPGWKSPTEPRPIGKP